ncbi:MAG: site-specific DNA-methyltransferase [Bacteroidales bacterium]|nr:site-specific DNA-methyltransferase [Bacteroidales bacterium]
MTENEYQQRIVQLEREVADLKAKLTAKQKATRYGLVWEDVPEAFEHEAENKIPILEEVKDKAIKNDDGKPTHILIEGDNYHALQCLNYTHRGKVDVIYIDPPYNTGSDGFTYKDKRFLKEFPDGTSVPKDHPLRHSYWLSFMSKRLELAKNLLSEKGVIFISIDDNEQANLKLLCDKVFGEENFVANFMWMRTATASNLSHTVRSKMEYILCYQNGGLDFILNGGLTEGGDIPLLNASNKISDIVFPKDSVVFKIKDGVYPKGIYDKVELLDDLKIENGVATNDLKMRGNFKWGQKTVNDEILNGTYFIIKTLKLAIRFQRAEKTTKTPSNLITKEECCVGTNEEGFDVINQIFNNLAFNYTKPPSLLQYLINMHINKSSIILDFFAGSGTTLHATMKLNAEDGGKRQCILVQQKEGDKNICESVTYERNKRVMQGYTNAKGEKVEGLGNSLKYYRTAFVGNHDAATATDEDKVALAHKAGCLIAIAENTLEEIEANNAYQIFQDGTRYTAVYFSGNLGDMSEFTEKLESLRDSSRLIKIEAYIYCLGNVQQFENEFVSLRRITLHAIPQPIIEIYKQLNA